MGPVLWLQPNYGGGALPAPLFALRGGLAREPVAQLPRPGAGGHQRPPEPSFDLCEGVVFLFLCRRFLGCLRRARVLGLMRLARFKGEQGLSLASPVRCMSRFAFCLAESLQEGSRSKGSRNEMISLLTSSACSMKTRCPASSMTRSVASGMASARAALATGT